ncbi:MAG TPA: flagellar hook-associated protein FlgK [Burkholderiaceae bacterium]
MAGIDVLHVAGTGLRAAQAGLNTTGNNIANANVPGYSRQHIIQSSRTSVQHGNAFYGNGTNVDFVQRSFDKFLTTQVVNAQSNASSLQSYLTEISQIDNMLSDPDSGLTPAIQDFFKGVQNLSSNPTQARQAMLSVAESLTGRFRGMEARLAEINDGVNSQIEGHVTAINAYASQIAKLNDSIAALTSAGGQSPNELLDQRDQVVAELSKVIKVNVTTERTSYTVSFGSGQPLVVGNQTFKLSATPSPDDISRTAVAYNIAGNDVVLSESLFKGGALGGLIDFRNQTLDQTRNAMGRIAVNMAMTFNAQHRLGQDNLGAMGGNFFDEPQPRVLPSQYNSAGNTTVVGATIRDPGLLTTSDYRVRFDGTDYSVTRLSDQQVTVISPYPQVTPQTIDGIDFAISSPAVALNGDSFLVRPTAAGAANIAVAIKDINRIAAAAPVTTAARGTVGGVPGNIGTAKASVGQVDANFTFASVTPPVTLTYDGTAVPPVFNFEQGVPPLNAPLALPVSVMRNGVHEPGSPFAAGTPVPFTNGATISFGGVSFEITGEPAQGDSFTIGPNTSGVGDNRNAQLLAALQTKNLVADNRLTFQGAYASLVGQIGNKTGELQITTVSAETLLEQTTQAQQSVSGVNLDEEGANLLRYQQAYQAAGKLMQVASQLFDVLMSLGR